MNPSAAAFVHIQQKLGVHVPAADNLSYAKACVAQRLVHRQFGTQRQSIGTLPSPVADLLPVDNADCRSGASGNADNPFHDQRQRVFQVEMARLNLALRLDDLRERESVIVFGSVIRRGGRRLGGLCLLLPYLASLRLELQIGLRLFAIVLLQHKRRLQQPFQGLLVKNWFAFFVGHDFVIASACSPDECRSS